MLKLIKKYYSNFFTIFFLLGHPFDEIFFARRFRGRLVERKFQDVKAFQSFSDFSVICHDRNAWPKTWQSHDVLTAGCDIPPQADISIILTLFTNCNHAWSQGNYNFLPWSNFFCLLRHLPAKYQLAFTYGKCLPRYKVNSPTSVNRSSLNTAFRGLLHSVAWRD